MHKVAICTIFLSAILATPSFAQKRCVVTVHTVGFSDQYSMAQYRGAFRLGQAAGNMKFFMAYYAKLESEEKAFDVNAGDRGEIIELDTMGDDSIAKVRIKGRGVLWMETSDLKCK